MRPIFQGQLHFFDPCGQHPYSRILDKISTILDSKPEIARQAWDDLTKGKKKKSTETGRRSLSADQVVRIAILMRINGSSYRDIVHELEDSRSGGRFARMGLGSTIPKKSAIQKDVKCLSPEIWEMINKLLVAFAADERIELGRKTRTDTTVVEANIHHPTDSSLLVDCIRVVTRLIEQALIALDIELEYTDHTGRSKRRNLDINNLSGKRNAARRRKQAYQDLLEISRCVFDYGRGAVNKLLAYEGSINDMVTAKLLAEELDRVLSLMQTVIDQTHRRVLQGESVPAQEKIVSIFEDHADIICKDNRDTYFGHKICLTTGASSLVTDLVIEKGNPADSTMVERSIERHKELYGSPPQKVSFDGGFASQVNLKIAKKLGVKDVMFHKKRGLAVEDMTSSPWIFKMLRRFRAGIEGIISALKRDFGLKRCHWRGEQGFHSYVWTGVVAFNLVTIAKHLLKL